MKEPRERPDPDALLRRMQKQDEQAKRGKLKVFFGFAPGVGKTYRMLQVARDLVREQQLDVVIGVVEDHRRVETARMVTGLEILHRRQVDYRGHTIEEFDLDAALARKPKLMLVDELAHTNAEGSRHPKRWQDVEELLDAGIDVFTTMNVQHIESLNDVIAQITRIQVRETVPDSMLDLAEAVELVDIAPEELLARLKEGKVYLPEQAKRAAEHFFQRGNLLALRELALRRTAQHVDEDVLEYREEHGVAATWPTNERILVCVGPAPSSGRLLRSAARMAARLRCPWVAAYVDSPKSRVLSDGDRIQLEAHLRMAESLGATVAQLTGHNVSEALLDYSRRHNVTRLIVGKPTHSRLWDRVKGSLLDDIVRGSGDIDVHVISGDALRSVENDQGKAADEDVPAGHYLSAVLLVVLTLVIGLLLRSLLDLPDLEMLFLLAVMVAGVWFGRGPSILTAALGVAFYDFFFVAPFHTFTVDDHRYFLTFGMMFAVGLAMSELAGRLRRQQQDAQAREERTGVLYALSSELAAAEQVEMIAAIAARHAGHHFAAEAFVLSLQADGELRPLGPSPAMHAIDVKDIGVAKWCYEHGALAGLGTETLPGANVLCVPLLAGHSRLGVLLLLPRERIALRLEQMKFLDVLCRQVAVALERARLSSEAKQSAFRAKTEEMRASLLSAVSHDLRTPLASITGAATSLRDDPNLDSHTRNELVEAIVVETERLERLVANLLDMTRLDSGEIVLRKEWVPLEEMIGSALTRLERCLGSRQVTVSIHPKVPLLSVDPVLFEQVFVNLLENAEKYTPAASPIEIDAQCGGDTVEVEVVDHGPGLPASSENQLFEKFYRGPHVGVSGAGLGLAICKAIVEAHGGTIAAASRLDGGATFHISLPTVDEPPSMRSPLNSQEEAQ